MTEQNSSGVSGGESGDLPASAAPQVVVEKGSDDSMLTQGDLVSDYKAKAKEAAAALEAGEAKVTDETGKEPAETPAGEKKVEKEAEVKDVDLGEVLGEEIVSKLSDKDKADIQKRFNKKHAEKRAAEETTDAVSKQLSDLKGELDKLKSGETDTAAKDSGPVGWENKIHAAKTEEELSTLREKSEDAKKFARAWIHVAEDELPFKAGEEDKEDGERWTKAGLNELLILAEDSLEKWLPSQSNFIKTREEWVKPTLEAFPWLEDKADENTVWVQKQRETPIGQMIGRTAPNPDYLLATLRIGFVEVQRLEAEKKAAEDGEKKSEELGTVKPAADKTNEIPSKPPSRGGAAAPAQRPDERAATNKQSVLDSVDEMISQGDLKAIYQNNNTL